MMKKNHQLLKKFQEQQILRLRPMNSYYGHLTAWILYSLYLLKTTSKQQVMQNQQKVQMLIQFLDLNLKKIKYNYQVDMMVQKYQLVLLLQLINHPYYPLKLDQMLSLQLNQQWCLIWITQQPLIHVIPDIPVIHQQKLAPHFRLHP